MARDPKTDVPRRVYRSTIDRIDAHLQSAPVDKKRTFNKGGRKEVKADFNQFLEMILDFYESMLKAPKLYASKTFENLEDARGEAIRESVRTKQPVQWPKVVIEVGDDE